MTRSLDAILIKFFTDVNVRSRIIERIAWANSTGYKSQADNISGVAGGGNVPVSINCQLWTALLLAQLIEQHKLTGILRVSKISNDVTTCFFLMTRFTDWWWLDGRRIRRFDCHKRNVRPII